MSQPSNPAQPPQPPQPKFDPAASHQQRPKVRALRGVPVEAQDQTGKKFQMLGLADARQISDRMVVVPPAAQLVIPLMDGSRGLDQIVTEVGRGLNREILENMIAQLDDAGLLEGPKFEAILADARQQFDASSVLPPAGTAAFADALVAQKVGQQATEEDRASKGPEFMREIFDAWMSESLKAVPNPSFDELPKAVVAPHLDYPRGWMNYAATYGRMRVCDRPDRVVILGTNHFGMGTGVVGCDKGFQTPLGTCEIDTGILSAMRASIGERLFTNRYDHEREHSIELHVPWIQHVFGKDGFGRYPTVFAALVHDPAVNNGASYDGKGVALDEFVKAMKAAIAGQPGKTLVVSSADLSHMGPAFGDQKPLIGDEPEVEAERNRIVQQDMQLLEHVVKNDPQGLIGVMAWQQNSTRWCSLGNLCAALMITEPSSVELLNYAGAIDSQGLAFVSSASLVMK